MQITAQDVLNTMHNADETVHLRVFDDRKGGIFSGEKISVQCGKFSGMVDLLKQHNNMHRGIFYVVNSGGQTDEEIKKINAQFVEMDNATFEEQQAKIDAFPLPPSMIIKTRKSLHTYWLIENGEVGKFRTIQRQLINHFDGDPACVNESRVMRLPGFYHCKKEPVMVECVLFHPERKYTQEELSAAMPGFNVEEQQEISLAGTEKGLTIVKNGCEFIKHCAENAASLPEVLWYGMITNLAVFEGGVELIHEYSKDYDGYSYEETQKKINHFLESGTRPMTCKVLSEKGFKCPKYGTTDCGCKAPAAMAFKPMDLDALTAMVKELPISNDALTDIKTCEKFISEFMYNIEPTEADSLFRFIIKEHFKFRNNDIKALVQKHKAVVKDFKQGLKARVRAVSEGLPPWYSPTEKGLKYMPLVLARHLAENVKIFYAADQYYLYEGGVYKPITELGVQRLVQENLLETEAKLHHITDTEHQLRMMVEKPIKDLNANPYIINLQNGLYNIIEEKLTEHTPGYYSTIQLNVNYNPEAKCERFRQYLTEAVDEEQIPLVQELMGYFLVPLTSAQKCFVIVGKGGTGKSQLLLVLNEVLLGKDNVSNVSWQSLNERFKTAELFGKLANIFADLPTKNIDDNGIFKALVGEDFLTAERKGCHPFSFQSKARLLFSCNTIPRNYGDKSEGFYRRLIILRFDNVVPEERKDRQLMGKFQSEADGIFMFALEGLKRLLKNEFVFSETEANRQELAQYREDSDSVLSFIHALCEVGEGFKVGSTDLFTAYGSYCEECGTKPYSQRPFIQQVLALCPEVERDIDRVGRKRILKGIKKAEIIN